MYCNHYAVFSFCGNNPELDFRIKIFRKICLLSLKFLGINTFSILQYLCAFWRKRPVNIMLKL